MANKDVIDTRYLQTRAGKLTPRAKEMRNTLNVNAVMVGLVILNFSATSGRPGAIIELARGGSKVYRDTWRTCELFHLIET